MRLLCIRVRPRICDAPLRWLVNLDFVALGDFKEALRLDVALVREDLLNLGRLLLPILDLPAEGLVALGAAFLVEFLVALGLDLGLDLVDFVPLPNKDLVFNLPFEPLALHFGAQPLLLDLVLDLLLERERDRGRERDREREGRE